MGSVSENHNRFMQVALRMARRGLGETHPNPSVGAVIVKDGQIIATATTAKGGRPHAETIAIENAGAIAKGTTLYVTLEPCSHHGKTPPCVDAIINSGIKTVVVACCDKNPIVSGNGIATLKSAGIEVIENICESEALEVNRGFFSLIEKKRPFIALKIATSMDGKITSPNSRWLTGEAARNYGQMLRSQYDAIITGSGTVLADDPLLTCRLAGLEHRSPIRIILDRSSKIPADAKFLNDGRESWIMRHRTIEEVIAELATKGISRLFVEAGAKLTTAFMESGLVDRVYWFKAPINIGSEGLSVEKSLSQLANKKPIEHIKLDNDILEVFECSQE